MFLEFSKSQKVILAYLDIVNNVKTNPETSLSVYSLYMKIHICKSISTCSMKTKIPSHFAEQ